MSERVERLREVAKRRLSPVCKLFNRQWFLGRIIDHRAEPTYEKEDVEAACEALSALPALLKCVEALQTISRGAPGHWCDAKNAASFEDCPGCKVEKIAKKALRELEREREP